jgi:probable phosphoglycerate mutase
MAENEARGLDFRPPGGESPRDVQARLEPWLAALAAGDQAINVAVAHKGVIRALYALAVGWDMTGKPPEKLRDGCGHLFEIDEAGRPAVVRLNVPLAPEGAP